MGFMEKLKNIFFEEEEEEDVAEPIAPKKEPEKHVETKEKVEKPPKEKLKDVIAKKVDFSKNEKRDKKEKILNLDDEEEKELEKKPEEIKPVIVEEKKEDEKKPEVKPKRETRFNTELIFDDEDFILDTKPKVKKIEPKKVEKTVVKEDTSNLYKGKDTKKSENKNDYPKPTYGKKEPVKTKTFTPSPIISPIYGILDKNYKKEEVKENKEIRISSRPSRMDLDTVRNKAFGDLEFDLMGNMKEEEIKENQPTGDEKTKVDLKNISSDDETPKVDKVTIGEADEYYNELGLAYNTDYKDLSKDLSDGKVNETKKPKDKEKLEDNLFDLIESMYNKEE